MDLMKYCHIIIYWKWGGRQICTFVGGRGGYQFHGVGKGCGGEADLFIFVICTCVGGRGGGLDVACG